jgi:hypothetical protein
VDVNYCVGHLQHFDHHLYVLRGRTAKRGVGEKEAGGGRRRWEEGGGKWERINLQNGRKLIPPPKKCE